MHLGAATFAVITTHALLEIRAQARLLSAAR